MGTNICIELVKKSDYPEIFQFEARNKDFFESVLPPRPSGYQQFDTFKGIMDGLMAEQRIGDYYMYVIRDSVRAIIGRINLQRTGGRRDLTGEIGYRMDCGSQGKGYATQAVKLLLEEAHGHYGLRSITAGAAAVNRASQAVLMKNGFRAVGVQERAVRVNGQWLEGILYRHEVLNDRISH
jgi:ribosomal-protein-alanine N-acetyltransferase